MSRLPAPPAGPIEGQRSRPLKHSAYRTRRQAHHVPLSTSFARSAQRARNRERATRLLPVHSASVDGGGSGGNGGDHDNGGHGGDDDDDDDWSARRRAIAAAPLLTRYAEATPGGLMRLLDWLGTIIFAVSGSLAAAASGLDLLGSTLVGLITAVGGGTIRDLIAGAGKVFWLGEFEYFILGVSSAAATYLLAPTLTGRWPNDHPLPRCFNELMKWGDAISVGAFAIIGAHNGVRLCLPLPACALFGMMTATFGGMVRDIICKRPVRIFHRNSEMYATVALISASVYSITTLCALSPAIRIASGLCTSITGRWYATSRDPKILKQLLP